MKGYIGELTKGEWLDDVNLNDGKLKCLYHTFQQWFQWSEGVGLESRSTPDRIKHDLCTAMEYRVTDLEFITT